MTGGEVPAMNQCCAGHHEGNPKSTGAHQIDDIRIIRKVISKVDVIIRKIDCL